MKSGFNFLHIPRTAGMSFYYFLEEIFGKENCIRFGNDKDVSEFYKNKTVNYDLFKVISGHLTISDFRDRGLLNGKRITVAFIRSPYEREISCFLNYFFSSHSDHIKIVNNSFFQCVDNFYSKTKYISQGSYLNLNNHHDDLDQIISSGDLILLPMSLLGEVSTLIKTKFSLDYYVIKNNSSSANRLSEKQKFILDLYVNNFILQYRKNDFKLFECVNNYGSSKIQMLNHQLNDFVL